MEYIISEIKLAEARKVEKSTQAYLNVKPEVERVALERKTFNKLIEKAQKQVNARARKSKAKPETVSSVFGYFNSKRINFYLVDV